MPKHQSNFSSIIFLITINLSGKRNHNFLLGKGATSWLNGGCLKAHEQQLVRFPTIRPKKRTQGAPQEHLCPVRGLAVKYIAPSGDLWHTHTGFASCYYDCPSFILICRWNSVWLLRTKNLNTSTPTTTPTVQMLKNNVKFIGCLSY